MQFQSKMIPVLFQVLLLFSGLGATFVNAASSCSATISSLAGMPRLLLVAWRGSHIYRRGRRC